MNTLGFWMAHIYVCMAMGAGGAYVLEKSDGDYFMWILYLLASVTCIIIVEKDT